ncbi:hypothetical protein B0T19DRAFT_491781 [Cercophora scortea]|uniref:Aminoglycoside phosphotransferase domain-containing protein n=1 Tax=Cercophora scortea TaxID=314031 RepID=A0AAE0MEI0_9PEZI|nr:hypothetical protein B0T19DRAFT_491781 [Cercophora scortea]
MPETLMLDRGPITLESALNKDKNTIHEAAYFAATQELCKGLWASRRTIDALVRHHLALGDGNSLYKCVVAPPSQWIRGSFNVCVPVEVKSRKGTQKRVVFRCAMPHKLAEARHPGTVDEKLSCEVGMYVWMQDQCDDVRIPHLYGFGFSDHRHFTREDQMPFYVRLWRAIQRHLRPLFGYPNLSRYAPNPTSVRMTTAYMLLEHIGPETGRMLSHTWEQRRGDPVLRQRLFRGMARVIISLARVPQPRIGSFEFRADGTVTLTNRPLSCCIPILENNCAPRTIPRSQTYTCVEPFVADMLAFHDETFLADQNAVYDASNCRGEMTARAILRTVSHHYVTRERRSGPFYLQLTDFHASNIFVDDDWNLTCLIDLEWICSLPAENFAAPYWLTGRGIDELEGDDLVEFEKVHQEFLDILEKEEIAMAPERKPALVNILRENWESGAVWFWHCLLSINAQWSLVDEHISPKYRPLSSTVEDVLYHFWCQDAFKVVDRKVDDYEEYEKELKRVFDKEA